MHKLIPADTDIVNIGSDTNIVSVSVQPYYALLFTAATTANVLKCQLNECY